MESHHTHRSPGVKSPRDEHLLYTEEPGIHTHTHTRMMCTHAVKCFVNIFLFLFLSVTLTHLT